MKVAKRLAKEKLRMFEALAAYANMGDVPDEWKRFRLMYPDFFPVTSGFKWKGFGNLDEWMYASAENWYEELRGLPVPLVPPLLWYRNRLRSVWARNDPHGYALAILLGFEKEAENIGRDHPGEVAFEPIVRPALIPGQRALKEESHGLPPGCPVINGVTGGVSWEFGCAIQQAVYELMRERWRAKICPMCGRFFVAMRTAQRLCSTACAENKARERALTWWNETGSKRRAKATKPSASPHGRPVLSAGRSETSG